MAQAAAMVQISQLRQPSTAMRIAKKRPHQMQSAVTVRPMPWAHKMWPVQVRRPPPAMQMPHKMTKTVLKHRQMPVMPMLTEVAHQIIKQEHAPAAVYHATKQIAHHTVHYAKVAIIIGGIELPHFFPLAPNSYSHLFSCH